MPSPEEHLEGLLATVAEAARTQTRLRIVGGDTKSFYGREIGGQPLSAGDYRGILAYEPTEMVITARAGTPLSEVEAALAERGQCLAFEPPHLGARATLGGSVACGLSGPRRPYAGAVRDFVLGVKLLNGRGEVLRFGGQVMKNVAGYDLSRLMAGALGTLGVILEVSLKVLPIAPAEMTLRQDMAMAEAIVRMNALAARPWPLSAAAWADGALWLRLSGARGAVRAARQALGGEDRDDAADFWRDLREQSLPFFAGGAPLWRLSLPPATAPLRLEGGWLIDWGGAQRWLKTGAPAEAIRAVAKLAGGHATLFRGGDRRGEVFTPLDAVEHALHRRLKDGFDPHHVLNIGRLYADF